jgi:transposase
LGLLVSAGGYPLAYDIFNGKSFEGHTLIPVIEQFRKTYGIDKFVVIADAGLFSQQNLALLEAHGMEYIVGARMKNLTLAIQQSILGLSFKNGEAKSVGLPDGKRLIVSYSEAREMRDRDNRLRGLNKLEKQLKKGKLSKKHLNNRGYNKYLLLEGDIKITIDHQKFDADGKWDGPKGYVTNSQLSDMGIIDNYNQLWHIENAFRVSKSALKVRPIYHRIQQKIEAHICLVFCAYKVYKELERQLKEKKTPLSITQTIEIMLTFFQVSFKHSLTGEKINKLLLRTEEQKYLAKLFSLI